MMVKSLVYLEVPMLHPAKSHQVHVTPNAVMTTAAAPSTGSRELAVWRVVMEPLAQGPDHVALQEQVWVVLRGEARCAIGDALHVATAGDSLVVPAGVARRITASADGLEALVSSVAGATVATPDAGERALPWAA
jgi:quercetin dioxygenase-like cupin family protein